VAWGPRAQEWWLTCCLCESPIINFLLIVTPSALISSTLEMIKTAGEKITTVRRHLGRVADLRCDVGVVLVVADSFDRFYKWKSHSQSARYVIKVKGVKFDVRPINDASVNK